MGGIFFKKGTEKLNSTVKSFYELKANDIDGNEVSMS